MLSGLQGEEEMRSAPSNLLCKEDLDELVATDAQAVSEVKVVNFLNLTVVVLEIVCRNFVLKERHAAEENEENFTPVKAICNFMVQVLIEVQHFILVNLHRETNSEHTATEHKQMDVINVVEIEDLLAEAVDLVLVLVGVVAVVSTADLGLVVSVGRIISVLLSIFSNVKRD